MDNSLLDDLSMHAPSINPEMIQAVCFCLVSAKCQLLESRLVAAGAVYDVSVCDLVVFPPSPGMGQYCIRRCFVFREPFKPKAAVVADV